MGHVVKAAVGAVGDVTSGSPLATSALYPKIEHCSVVSMFLKQITSIIR